MTKIVPAKEPDWQRLSKEWECSGLSQKQFCEERGISYISFCYRRGELRKRERQKSRLYPVPAQPRAVGQFIPVSVEPEEPKTVTRKAAVPPTPEVEVQLPFGVVLRFRGMAQS